MITIAPDLYPVNSAQLREEMRYIEVTHSMKWGGPITIITGVRRDQVTDLVHPVLIVKSAGRDAMHLIVLPGD